MSDFLATRERLKQWVADPTSPMYGSDIAEDVGWLIECIDEQGWVCLCDEGKPHGKDLCPKHCSEVVMELRRENEELRKALQDIGVWVWSQERARGDNDE